MTTLERELRTVLREQALTVAPDPDVLTAVHRRAATIRARHRAAAMAMVAVVAILTVLPGRGMLDRLRSGMHTIRAAAPAAVLDWPTRGDLAGDPAVVRDATTGVAGWLSSGYRTVQPEVRSQLLWLDRLDGSRTAVVAFATQGVVHVTALAQVRSGRATLWRSMPYGSVEVTSGSAPLIVPLGAPARGTGPVPREAAAEPRRVLVLGPPGTQRIDLIGPRADVEATALTSQSISREPAAPGWTAACTSCDAYVVTTGPYDGLTLLARAHNGPRLAIGRLTIRRDVPSSSSAGGGSGLFVRAT